LNARKASWSRQTTALPAPPLHIMMVPGGEGTRTELKNPVFLDYLRAQDQHTQLLRWRKVLGQPRLTLYRDRD
jgi:putative intracellular protease/amidase